MERKMMRKEVKKKKRGNEKRRREDMIAEKCKKMVKASRQGGGDTRGKGYMREGKVRSREDESGSGEYKRITF